VSRDKALGRLAGRSAILLAYLVLLILGLFGLLFSFLNYPWLAIGLLLLLLLAVGKAKRQRRRTQRNEK
jgi:hypothetical protein